MEVEDRVCMAAESPVAIINQKGSQPSVGWSAGQPRPTRTEFRARNASTYESASHASTTGAPDNRSVPLTYAPPLLLFLCVGEQRGRRRWVRGSSSCEGFTLFQSWICILLWVQSCVSSYRVVQLFKFQVCVEDCGFVKFYSVRTCFTLVKLIKITVDI